MHMESFSVRALKDFNSNRKNSRSLRFRNKSQDSIRYDEVGPLRPPRKSLPAPRKPCGLFYCALRSIDISVSQIFSALVILRHRR